MLYTAQLRRAPQRNEAETPLFREFRFGQLGTANEVLKLATIGVRNIQMLPCMQEMASPPVRKAAPIAIGALTTRSQAAQGN
jgi:hypothetical protein